VLSHGHYHKEQFKEKSLHRSAFVRPLPFGWRPIPPLLPHRPEFPLDSTLIMIELLLKLELADPRKFPGRWISFDKDGKTLTTSNDNWEHLAL
jgi:hypothetical protein